LFYLKGVEALHKIVVFSKDGCHLCERAIDTLRSLEADRKFTLEVVEIASDKQLFDKYFLSIPVVRVDGKDVFDAEDIGLPEQCKSKLTKLVTELE
jgi:glutaredoxin